MDCMSHSHTLVAHYWEARACALPEATAVLLSAFQALQEAGLSRFFHKGRSRKAANTPFIPGEEAISRALAKGVNRRDIDRSPIPELGHSFGLWSGDKEPEAFALSLRIGSTSPHARNLFLLELPTIGPHALQREPDKLKALFTKLGVILDSAQGIVCARGAIEWDDGRLCASIPSLARWPAAA